MRLLDSELALFRLAHRIGIACKCFTVVRVLPLLFYAVQKTKEKKIVEWHSKQQFKTKSTNEQTNEKKVYMVKYKRLRF